MIPGRDPAGCTPNMTRAEAGLRGIAAVVVLALVLFNVHVNNAEWALTLLLHGFVLVAYLALSAVARIDPFYGLMDVDRSAPRARRERAVVEPPRGRPVRSGRPS